MELQSEKEPTSLETKPEVAQHQELPKENATALPVEEPKKVRRRD
jgi:hypothetical protein